MDKIFDTRISLYRSVEDTAGREIPIGDFLFSDRYRAQVEAVRGATDEEVQKRLKRSLPQATVSGTFSPTRSARNLVCHSRLLCVDIDRKDNMGVEWISDLGKEWRHIPQILYAAHSVRGEGWFAIFRIASPERHKAHFEALRRDFASSGLVIDSSCKDVCRMRTVSYDPEPYVNENATIYNKVWEEPRPSPRTPCPGYGDGMEAVERCCREIAMSGTDITAGYDNWFRVGAALASLGERGRGLFHMVSAQNGKYNAAETDRKFDQCLRTAGDISIGTFFYICSQHGIDWKEVRP